MATMAHGASETSVLSTGPADCAVNETWDGPMGMCMPSANSGVPMAMLIVNGNAFAVYITEQGPRGRNTFAGPNMFMVDLGKTFGERHYLNLDYMGTVELWTFPSNGSPELLQIGENQSNGQPFLDAQHPHSSPVMGLTLSDTINLGENESLKLFLAPRGESTDGPVAFMHRPTGKVNPDVPLGHHIGQDVGHISSTVIGEALKLGNFHIEASAFHGAEPQPTQVDLPLGTPDSGAFRLTEELSSAHSIMASVAYVNAPEPADPDIAFEVRTSASLYDQFHVSGGWEFFNTLIYGAITQYDHASILNSFLEEFWFHKEESNFWGRVEYLQRTSAELQISKIADQNSGQWVWAFTAGYTRALAHLGGAMLGLGGSVTADALPDDFSAAYGTSLPLTGKIFLQVSGMGMTPYNKETK